MKAESERDDEHRQGAEDDVEEAIDAAGLQLHAGSGYRVGLRENFASSFRRQEFCQRTVLAKVTLFRLGRGVDNTCVEDFYWGSEFLFLGRRGLDLCLRPCLG